MIKSRWLRATLAAVTLALLAPGAAQAAVYTDKAAWTKAGLTPPKSIPRGAAILRVEVIRVSQARIARKPIARIAYAFGDGYLHVEEACDIVNSRSYGQSQANANALADATHAGGYYRGYFRNAYVRNTNHDVGCQITSVWGLLSGRVHKVHCRSNAAVQEKAYDSTYRVWYWAEYANCWRTYAA